MSETKLYVMAYRRLRVSHTSYGDRIEHKDFPQFFKLGISGEPEKRLASMNTSTPNVVELVTTVESSDPMYVEQFLHEMNSGSHFNGEWFQRPVGVDGLKRLERLDPTDFPKRDSDERPAWLTGVGQIDRCPEKMMDQSLQSSFYDAVMQNREVSE